MTTHRRAWLLRAGAAAVLVTSALVTGLASPAAAAVTIAVQPGSFDMNPGDVKNVVVQFSGEKTDDVAVTFTAPSANGNITIKAVPPNAGCDSAGGTSVTCSDVDVPQNGALNLTFQLQAKTPSTLAAGQNLNDQQGTVSAAGGATGNYKVNLKGPAATQPAVTTVAEVSGTVNDSTTAKGVKGATVVMQDSAGKSRQAATDDAGKFRFLGTEANPIAPGNISLSVTLTGYDAATKDVTGQVGKVASTKVPLVPIGSTASPVVPSAGEETTPAAGDSQSTAAGAANTANTSNSGGSGMSSYILIALGALLVVFGIVAIVLLLRRRGDDDDDEDLEEEPAPRRGGGGGQRPGYRQPQADPTMVGAMGGPPTMINRGAANDATAIVRPGAGRANDYDVPPDPYGAPLPRAGSGYGAAGAGAGYGAANGGGYGDQAGYAQQGAPSAGGGYGPSSRPPVDPYGPEYGAGGNGYNDQGGGYGGAQASAAQGGGGYADSTQRWEPSAGNGYAGGQTGGGGQGGYGPGGGANGYGADGAQNGYGGGQGGGYNDNGANGYGADQGGYGPGAGADQGGYAPGGAGGYGPAAGQGGYGPAGGAAADDGYPSAGQGGYGPSAGNGYNGQADYDGPYAGRGGYEQRGGYEPAEQRGGYEPAAGYERDGYERVPEPPRAGNGHEAGNGNYEQRGGYGDPQASPRGAAGNANRRSLDWLDD